MISYDLLQQHDEWGNAPDLLAKADAEALEDGRWRRAGGDCECRTCGKKYYDHPRVLGALWLTRTCSGKLFKL